MASDQDIPKISKELCNRLLGDLEKAKRPVLYATKCSLDNANYMPRIGYLTPGDKKVATELNVSSVKKMSRAIFMLEVLLGNIDSGAVNTKRELYYIAKGQVKNGPNLKPLDFADQTRADDTIDFICELLECYREEVNCYANDRGGQTYSQQLVVTENDARWHEGHDRSVEARNSGISAEEPPAKPEAFGEEEGRFLPDRRIRRYGQHFGAERVSPNAITRILMGAQGVPSNAVRGWCKLIQDQLKVPMYFFGDLDAYTIQNIYRTLKAGSAASLIRNSDFSAPDVRFLGVLPEDIKKYDLLDYGVKENDAQEVRALKRRRTR